MPVRGGVFAKHQHGGRAVGVADVTHAFIRIVGQGGDMARHDRRAADAVQRVEPVTDRHDVQERDGAVLKPLAGPAFGYVKVGAAGGG